jgi:hypothetical protein
MFFLFLKINSSFKDRFVLNNNTIKVIFVLNIDFKLKSYNSHNLTFILSEESVFKFLLNSLLHYLEQGLTVGVMIDVDLIKVILKINLILIII